MAGAVRGGAVSLDFNREMANELGAAKRRIATLEADNAELQGRVYAVELVIEEKRLYIGRMQERNHASLDREAALTTESNALRHRIATLTAENTELRLKVEERRDAARTAAEDDS